MYNASQPEQTCVYNSPQFVTGQPIAMQMMTPDVPSAYFGSEAGNTGAPGLQEAASSSRASVVVYQQIPPNFQQDASEPSSFAEGYRRNLLSLRPEPTPRPSTNVHLQIPPGFHQTESISGSIAPVYRQNPLNASQRLTLRTSTNVHRHNPLGSRADPTSGLSADVYQRNPLSSRQGPIFGASSSAYQRDPLSLLRAGPSSRISTASYQQNPPNMEQADPDSEGQGPSSELSANLQRLNARSMSYVAILPSTGTTPTEVSVPVEQKPYPQETLDEMWIDYQKQLADFFEETHHGSLQIAAEALLHISDWLLSHVLELDLNNDQEWLHTSRMRLWQNFNYAWLALGQRQIDIMETRQQLSSLQDLMTKETVKQLGSELVRLCNRLQNHGLVDYEYGVWEERIIDSLLGILDLYETSEGAIGGSGGVYL